jgi:hypothetical protein
MTPSARNQPADHSRRWPSRNVSDLPRTARGRHRSTSRPVTRVRTLSSRAATVWPFADEQPLPGTALLAGWLGRTIVALVTGYTRPGDRVLLLSPPTVSARSAGVSDGTRSVDPYAGLTEAVWTTPGSVAASTPRLQHPRRTTPSRSSKPHASRSPDPDPRDSDYTRRPHPNPSPHTALTSPTPDLEQASI